MVEFLELIEGEGRVWRSVGVDMELNENRTLNYHGQTMDIYNMDDKFLTKPEIRHKKNMEHVFSKEQLALLYRMDPSGVVFYVKEYCRLHINGVKNTLDYKDDVYRAIFKVNDNNFYCLPNTDGILVHHWTYNPESKIYSREEVYSDAELLFGAHKIIKFDWLDFIKAGVIALFGAINPYLGLAISTAEMCSALFFAGSVSDGLSSATTEVFGKFVKETNEKWRERLFNWGNFLFEVLKGAIEAVNVINTTDVKIYKCIRDIQNYRVIVYSKNKSFDMQKIIDLFE